MKLDNPKVSIYLHSCSVCRPQEAIGRHGWATLADGKGRCRNVKMDKFCWRRNCVATFHLSAGK